MCVCVCVCAVMGCEMWGRLERGLGAYTLQGRNEQHIQHEQPRLTDVLLDNLPSVILTPHLIPALPPVIVRQARRPDDAEREHIIQLRRRQPIHSRPDGEMRVVEGGQDGPDAVDLAVIAVDFGDDEEDGDQENGEGEACDARVGRGVEVGQGGGGGGRGVELGGEGVELGEVGFEGYRVGGAVGEGGGEGEDGGGERRGQHRGGVSRLG